MTAEIDGGSDETPTAPVAGVADDFGPPPVVEALTTDDDGWPTFADEPELPEERIAPEEEPPTEEIPTLDGAETARAGATGEEVRESGEPGRRDRPGWRSRRGGRGRREREPGAEEPAEVLPSRAPPGAEPEPGAPRAGARGAPEGRGSVLPFFRPERLDACQRAIGYHFRDLSLLENALTHSSIKSEDRPSYERLEFLGDSVVGLVISQYLYDRLPECDEGELTKVKSIVVSTDGLAAAAKVCGLERFLALGRGLLMKEAVPKSLIADVFEGVAGAVYLDRGWESARYYVLDHLVPFVDEALSEGTQRNFKSVLQQVAQRDLGETPHYDLLRQGGPEHSRQFEVVAVLGRRRFPSAKAPTKREAEQAAARIAIQMILLERGHGEISNRRREKHSRPQRPPQRRDRGPSPGGRSR